LVLPWVRPAAAVAAPIAVEPAELTRRADLVGREVEVEDRLNYFQFHRDKGFDEIHLKRTPVVFRLPPRLRPEHQPDAAAVRVWGILQKQGSQYWCDVAGFELLPSDVERLKRASAGLGPGDWKGRNVWARWAAQRGKEFQDKDLLERAGALEAEAIRIEAEQSSADPPRHWLELAERARRHGVPEPEPSALAHRAFRARLAQATSAADLKALLAAIEAFFPMARTLPPAAAGLSGKEALDAQDPATYRDAPAAARVMLDHQLWAAVIQRVLETQATAQPQDALALGDQAVQLLPDQPAIAAALWARGLQHATRNISSLRKIDVDNLARLCCDKLHQPERAREVYRLWLDDQREHRLSPSDAEGRVALATQYESYLGDKASAVALLRAAWKIDPASNEVAEAFRQRGFRKVEGEWVEPRPTDAAGDLPSARTTEPSHALQRGDSLLRCTPQEVRQRLGGKPTRIARSATQGQLIEQWIYVGANQNQYVNFLYRDGDPQPKVVAFFSLPHLPARSGAAP
jgi:tetratricopeptide (TPR) repeat protein